MPKDKTLMVIDPLKLQEVINQELRLIPPHIREDLSTGKRVWVLNFVDSNFSEPGTVLTHKVTEVFGTQLVEDIAAARQAPTLVVVRSPQGEVLDQYLLGVYDVENAPN